MDLQGKHLGHKVCIFFMPPQVGHLFRFVTSFRALPAICLCLFFMCEVFDFGTALSIPSHMSPKIEGIPATMLGIAIASEGIEGKEDFCACCE